MPNSITHETKRKQYLLPYPSTLSIHIHPSQHTTSVSLQPTGTIVFGPACQTHRMTLNADENPFSDQSWFWVHSVKIRTPELSMRMWPHHDFEDVTSSRFQSWDLGATSSRFQSWALGCYFVTILHWMRPRHDLALDATSSRFWCDFMRLRHDFGATSSRFRCDLVTIWMWHCHDYATLSRL